MSKINFLPNKKTDISIQRKPSFPLTNYYAPASALLTSSNFNLSFCLCPSPSKLKWTLGFLLVLLCFFFDPLNGLSSFSLTILLLLLLLLRLFLPYICFDISTNTMGICWPKPTKCAHASSTNFPGLSLFSLFPLCFH